MPQPKTGKVIQSVQRAVDIINCFDNVSTELTLGQLSTMLGLNKSTVHGILNTLHNNDFIRQTPAGKYMLGKSLVRKYHFADGAKRNLMMEEARDEMVRIANEYHTNCGLYMVELGELVLVNRILPENEMYTINFICDSYVNPLYCTASGKLLLSQMTEDELDVYLRQHPLTPHTPNTITTREKLCEAMEAIRKAGYSLENEELGVGVSAISAPIFSPTGQLFATISTTGMTFHLESRREDIILDLKVLARNISKKIF